jgi:hypothetical protein
MLGFKSSREFLGVPTVSDWMSHTTGLTVLHRGPELSAIDQALVHYHQTKASPALAHGGWKAVLTKMKITTLQLVSILKACEDWLASKTESGEIARSSRAPVIRRLHHNCLDEILVLLPDRGGFDPSNISLYLYQVASDIRWKMILPLIHNTTDHRHLHIDNALEANPGGINPDHFLGSDISHQFKGQNEFNFLFDMIRSEKVKSETVKILYLDRDARWQHRICIEGGLVYRVNENGDPDTEKPVTGHGQFVISGGETKRMYYLNREAMGAELERANAGVAVNEHRFEIRHSTFLAGEACSFAGGLTFSEIPGKIASIDNCSGHYQPSVKEFIAAINLMNLTKTLDLKDIYLEAGVYGFTLDGEWSYNARAICTADIATQDLPEFKRLIDEKQKIIFDQALDEGVQFSGGGLIDRAAALGFTNLTPSTSFDVTGNAVTPKTPRLDQSSTLKIRTKIDFF